MITNENAPNAGKHEANFETTCSKNTNQYQADSQAYSMPLLCSGYGQYHTYEPGKNNRKTYALINFKGIQRLVDTPQQIDKQHAQWLVPSTLLSQSFKEQESNGEFWVLWADIDQATNSLIEIADIIESLIPVFDYEIYTSKSATQDNQKCRILIPLNKPLSGADWVLYQQILNDKLQDNGISPDRTSERAAQLCYLPNRGEYYDRKSKRNGAFFDPSLEWANEIKNTQDEIARKAAELERLSNEAKSRREAFNSYSGTTDASPSLIHAFNAAHAVQDVLLQAGYDQIGDTFRHSNSESGSFSASVKDGKVHSLSSNDPLYTNGGGIGAHDAFSAFTVLKHNGDLKAALKDAGDNWVKIGSESWNKVKQREYDQQRVKDAFSPRGEDDTPRSFEDILIEAKALSNDSQPDDIQKLAFETRSLSMLQQRRVFEAIKRKTGTPIGLLDKSLKDHSESSSDNHLFMARRVIEETGIENITASQEAVWQWNASGVWRKLEKRAVKQMVQNIIVNEIDGVSKHIVDSVCDLLETEIYNKDQEFNVGHDECVNCQNGELSLIDGEWQLLPHERKNYRTTQVPVVYAVNATAPRFLRFLDEVFAGDSDKEDKIKALLEMMGYSLMAHCKYEKFIILVGIGANGKSVILSVLASLIGKENISGVQPSTFDRSFHRAHLHGKLANIVTEIKQGEVIDDASLKGIVSGEPTTVEHKFGHPFVMRPFATCWFGTNHMPHTRDFSDALFRRALILKFNNVFKSELGNCDPSLRDTLTRELPGILNMALNAYAKAIAKGFTMPRSCIEARDEWHTEADQVSQFIDDECVRDDKKEVQAQLLYGLYREWARASGTQQILTMKSFRNRLTLLGFGARRTSEVRYVTGLSCIRAMEGAFGIMP